MWAAVTIPFFHFKTATNSDSWKFVNLSSRMFIRENKVIMQKILFSLIGKHEDCQLPCNVSDEPAILRWLVSMVKILQSVFLETN